MKGTVERIWENRSLKGESYWVVSIDGERYSIWNPNLMHNLKEGDMIDFSWQPSGDFKRITHIRKSASHQDEVSTRDRHIIRMSCIRSASEIVGRLKGDAKEKTKLALKMSRRFEKHVTKPPISRSESHERQN